MQKLSSEMHSQKYENLKCPILVFCTTLSKCLSVWIVKSGERSLDVTTTPLLSTPSVICFESKKSLRCTFPPVPNSTIGRQRRKLPSNSFSSLENWFSKALCHRYFSCVLCVMVSIYSFKRRHFYLSQLFKKGSTDIPFNLSLASIPER